MPAVHTVLASVAFARAAAPIVASAMARNISSSAFAPAAWARIDGPDIASCVPGLKSRRAATCASMLAPPKQLRPSTTAMGAPAARAASASRKRRRNAPSASSPSETRAPAESR